MNLTIIVCIAVYHYCQYRDCRQKASRKYNLSKYDRWVPMTTMSDLEVSAIGIHEFVDRHFTDVGLYKNPSCLVPNN